MESIAIFPSQIPPSLFDKPSSPPQIACDFFDKLNLEPIDFLDSQEDSLTKDTNTPKELNRFEENPVPGIGLLDKKIQKLRTREKKNPLQDERIACLAKARDRRSAKKPADDYENIRTKDEERQKEKRTKRKQQKMMKDTVVKTGDNTQETETVKYSESPEDPYKWRDWNLYFREELAKLSSEEFITFFNVILSKHPECVSFEKGYGELKIGGAINKEEHAEVSELVEQNAGFQLFCGYIEEIRKRKGKAQHCV